MPSFSLILKYDLILFDVIIPYEDKTTEKELVNKFEEVLNKDSKTKINVVLHFDRPFVER